MLFGYLLPCTVIVGGFFGDEGKGKIAAYLAMKDKPDICVRGGNGAEAGHTVIYDGGRDSLTLIPSGFLKPPTRPPPWPRGPPPPPPFSSKTPQNPTQPRKECGRINDHV